MATAAQRAQKKDLGPDWRETLAASIRSFVRRTVGLALIGLSVALGVALVTHSSVDPSFTTAAGGTARPIGSAHSAPMPAMRCCSCSGLPSALFLPLVALIGLRMVRGVDTGPMRRALLVAALGVALIGIALGLYAGSAVSGLPAGYGGALGLAGAYGVDCRGAAGRQSVDRRAVAAGADGDPDIERIRRRLVRARHSAGGEAMGGG